MKLQKITFFLLFSLYSSYTLADNKLIGFFEPAPDKVLNSIKNELFGAPAQDLATLKSETKTETELTIETKKKEFDKKINFKLGGIPMLYGGFLSYGKTIDFPLRHTSQKLYIVVTPSIRVVPIEGETLSHLTLEKQKNPQPKLEQTISTTSTPGMQTIIEKEVGQAEPKIYLLEKKENTKPIEKTKSDTKTETAKSWYWKVTEEKLPEKGKINPISLILITNPNNIFIKTGDHKATEEAHLRLPPIYIIGNMDNEKTLLKFIDLSKYFEQLTPDKKNDDEKKNSQTILLNN